MSIQVKCFDVHKAEDELRKCPKIVRDYVKLLKGHQNKWMELFYTALKKIRTISAQLQTVKKENEHIS